MSDLLAVTRAQNRGSQEYLLDLSDDDDEGPSTRGSGIAAAAVRSTPAAPPPSEPGAVDAEAPVAANGGDAGGDTAAAGDGAVDRSIFSTPVRANSIRGTPPFINYIFLGAGA